MSPARARGVLGVSTDAGPDAVREAYREKVKEVHPDRGGSAESFKRVTEAYEALEGAA
jgi:curved DNA-binding protein CbpA